jgi:hypothetical protein
MLRKQRKAKSVAAPHTCSTTVSNKKPKQRMQSVQAVCCASANKFVREFCGILQH